MSADVLFGLVLVGVCVYAALYTVWQWFCDPTFRDGDGGGR